jgi:hypothetical protein
LRIKFLSTCAADPEESDQTRPKEFSQRSLGKLFSLRWLEFGK